MITTVADEGIKQSSKKNGRAESKVKELERKLGDIPLDKRGVPSGVGASVYKGERKLVERMSKGIIEQMLQKKFVLNRDKYELKL